MSYDIDEFEEKATNFLCTGLVTRYGSQISCQAQSGQRSRLKKLVTKETKKNLLPPLIDFRLTRVSFTPLHKLLMVLMRFFQSLFI